jgi:hypothetical protein
MNEISHQYMTLINTMLENYDKWEVHSFRIDEMHRLTYGKVAITNWADGVFLINWTDCLLCDGAHVNCIEREIITQDAYEALEFAAANGYSQ